MAEEGEEKLIAVARQIAKSIGRTGTMADDILDIFSTFDGRFSREKLSSQSVRDEGDFSGNHPIERNIRSLDRQISRLVNLNRSIWSDPGDSGAFLDAIDGLLASRRELDPMMPGEKRLIDVVDNLLQKSMIRLEDEFKSLMDQGLHSGSPLDPFLAGSPPRDSYSEEFDDDRIPIAHPVTDYNIVIDALPWGTISELSEIAKRMVATGSGSVCAETYSISRRRFLEESISRLGLHPWTTEEVQERPWTELNNEIQRWIHAIRVAVRVLFPSERRLCNRIFADIPMIADLSFAEVCRVPAVQLMAFAVAVAIGSKAPERLFRIVDMYEALTDLQPDIGSLFSDQHCSFLLSESSAVTARLATSIRGIFTELENLIHRDPAKSPLPGGGIHPITRYVMNYLRAASASWRTLEEVMEEEEDVHARGTTIRSAAENVRPSSYLAVQIGWIMEILQGNLDMKSKLYRDPSLSCLFLMNNGRYVIQKVKDTELMQLLGEDWVRRQMTRLRQYHSTYNRTTWSKLVEVLHVESSSDGSFAKSVKEKLRRFNLSFEEIYKTQTGWSVPDEQLRTELRISAVGFVLPAYSNFLGRCKAMVESGRHMDRWVKYSADEVEARLNGLFEGTDATPRRV